MKTRIVLAAIAVCLAAAAHAASDVIADFRVGGVSFTVPIPKGYCVPSGKMADIAQVVAAADTTNVTNATLVGCDAPPVVGANDYTVIKSPRNGLLLTVDRKTLLAAVGKEFEKKFDPNASLAAARKDVQGVFGVNVDISGTFAPRGKDDVCAYLAGVIHYQSGSIAYDQPMAGCITAVGGRILYVYRTGTKGDTASLLTLLRETREIALSIKVMSGT